MLLPAAAPLDSKVCLCQGYFDRVLNSGIIYLEGLIGLFPDTVFDILN
jgi:hypothetical protein